MQPSHTAMSSSAATASLPQLRLRDSHAAEAALGFTLTTTSLQ